MVSSFVDALQRDGRVQEERGDGMINTIVTFVIGVFFGIVLLAVISCLIAGRDYDENMPDQ